MNEQIQWNNLDVNLVNKINLTENFPIYIYRPNNRKKFWV